MDKQYKIIVNNGKTAAQEIDVRVGQGQQPVRMVAKAGDRYLLQDPSKKPVAAPETVRASRKGKNLHLSLDGSELDDIVIENYYDTFAPDYNAVTGLGEDGQVYEYIPQDPAPQSLLPQLADGAAAVDMVLGGEGFQAAGAAVAAVAPLVGPGTLAAGAGAAAAAAGGGGGGGAATDAAATARADIQKFAQDNSTGLVNAKGTAPTATTYSTAGVTGVSDANLAAINDALASAYVDGARADTPAEIQTIVNAYQKILAEADGNATDNSTGAAVASAADYTAVGVTGVTADSSKLLSDVVDNLNTGAVDTIAELQALADSAKAAVGYTGGNSAPTASQLNALIGSNAVNADNLAAVRAAVVAANSDGTPVTQAELQAIASNVNAAVSSLGAFAQANASGLANATGTVPTTATYSTAGVTGVSDSNLAAINDALASAYVDGGKADTAAKVQTVVDAYQRIIAAADGTDANTSAANSPTVADYTAIGVTGVTAAVATLLSDVADSKVLADIDTVAEVQALADAAQAAIAYTGTGTGPTAAQINALVGLGGNVSDAILPLVLQAVAAANTNTTGDGANAPITQAELQAIVDRISGALAKIQAYANDAINPVPDAADYAAIGVNGQLAVASINSALADADITAASVPTPASVQAIVNAYTTILAEANGSAADATPGQSPDAATYSALGINGVTPNSALLLGEVIGDKTGADVDTVAKIQALADVANRIVNSTTAGVQPTATLADLQALGVTGVNAGNLDRVLVALAGTTDGGAEVNTLAKL